MTRSELDARLAALRAIKTARKESETKVAEAAETMRTIANLFSASAWSILPQKIKAYFQAYRN